jgi:hypothetical protein
MNNIVIPLLLKICVHLHDYLSLCRRCFEVDTGGVVAGVFDGAA